MSETPRSSGVKRRDFLKILGSTTAVAGCNMDQPGKLIPYLVSPDNTVPGVSTYYVTTCRECSTACGVIAETRDGRAIKLEGNPEHPVNRGALCARGQAALQGLYNPDRIRGPMVRRPTSEFEEVSWEEATALLVRHLGEVRASGAAGRAVFVNQHETGSFPAFLDQWLAAFGMPAHVPYDAEADTAAAMAHQQAYGVAWPRFDFSAARLVVSFGADFLDGWGASVPQQLAFADARAKLDQAPRFVYIGPRRSLTGLNADEWIDCRPGSELAIARAILGGGSVESAATESGVTADRLTRLAREIAAARPALVLASGTTGSGSELSSAVAAFNRTSGSVGSTILTRESIAGLAGIAPYAEMTDLVARMNNGQVPVLFVRGVNPAYTMPKAAAFTEAMAKVPFKVSFSSYRDETTELCDLILPDHHSLEQWGDAEPVPGVLGLQQPVMDPVFRTRAVADTLLAAAQADPAVAGRFPQASYRDWLISRFPGGAPAFASALVTGLASGAPARTAATRRPLPPPAAPGGIEQTEGDFYFVPFPSPTLGVGRGANKPWLQELPDPVSKICWQSWVEIHPLTAREMGIDSGDHIRITTAVGEVTAPAYLYLGIRRDTVAMPMGQGHTAYGRYAKDVGVNVLDATPSTLDPRVGGFLPVATKARVAKAGSRSRLVTTEGSARQHGRGIARAVLASALSPTAPPAEEAAGHGFMGDASHEFLPGLRAPVADDAQGELGSDQSTLKGMYDPGHWSGMAKRRWAMTIDLARCTGCSACMTACYAENNIPTVGAPHQGPHLFADRTGPGANITRSREMTWIRIERYFEGGEHGENEFEARFIPMLCQHCGNAPCEPVCPVYATYHAPDGLNVQVYNRCVGTRYCSNNCPYKVRYFNWFGYGEPDRDQYAFPEPLNWQLNPDVTVRAKGVMEKCSFCVQRIRDAENRASGEKRALEPDEFTVACAQACPSRAITFGDAAEEGWAVTDLIEDRRAYHVFEELNTFTAVVYLQKVNHPAPGAAEPAAVAAGGSRGE